MSVTPLEIQCPKCSQIYRFGSKIPQQLACRVCQTVMDLRGFALPPPREPVTHAANRPSLSVRSEGVGTRRDRPAFKPRKPQSVVATWATVAVITIFVGGRIFGALRRSGVPVTEAEVRPSNADSFAKRMHQILDRRGLLTSREINLLETSAWEGDVLTVSPAKIEGIYSMGEPTDEILVNDVVARTGNGPFSVDVPLKAGDNAIEISFRSKSGIDRHAIHVTYKPPR